MRLCGGVINYCNPKRHRDIRFPEDRRWKVAVGVHPKHALTIDEPALDALGRLICDVKILKVQRLNFMVGSVSDVCSMVGTSPKQSL